MPTPEPSPMSIALDRAMKAAETDPLVEALQALEECITDDNACCMNTGQKTRRLKAIDDIARAVLAKYRPQA